MENKLSGRQIRWVAIWGSIISFIFAASFHFGYDRTGFEPLSLICAVNESIWEHMKILFFGAFFINLILYFSMFKNNLNYIVGAAVGMAAIVVLVPTVVGIYTSIIGREIFIVDFILSILLAFICQFIIILFLRSKRNFSTYAMLAFFVILLLIGLFVVFRYFPPELGIFIPQE